MQKRKRNPEKTREKMLIATIDLIRHQGFHRTTLDEICAKAGVTKGSFFHHFPDKASIGKAAIFHWCSGRANLYAEDMGSADADPLKRLHRLLRGLSQSVELPTEKPVCLLGMMAQELAESDPAMREICAEMLTGWTQLVAGLLREAKTLHPYRKNFDPEAVAWLINSTWQGSLLTAKTLGKRDLVRQNLKQIENYVTSLFVP